MKVIVLIVALLLLFVGLGFSENEPKFEWTSGNYFDFLLMEIDFTRSRVYASLESDQWSGYHHLSFPVADKMEFYIGFGYGLLDPKLETGIGWNFRRTSTISWEPHITLFGGNILSWNGPDGIAFGARSALKFQLTFGTQRRFHLFAGTGLTLTYFLERALTLSIPFETGLTISSKKKRS